MAVPPESILAGRCYLLPENKMARVLHILPGERVQYEFRECAVVRAFGWKEDVLELLPFAFLVEREVPCDWMPEK